MLRPIIRFFYNSIIFVSVYSYFYNTATDNLPFLGELQIKSRTTRLAEPSPGYLTYSSISLVVEERILLSVTPATLV